MKKIMSIVTFIVAMSISIVAFATSSSSTRTPHAIILEDLCLQCETCIAVCPNDAIVLKGNDYPTVIVDRCDGCGKCMEACPNGAIWLEEFGN